MSKVLVIAEHGGGKLNISTARTLACAAELGEVDILVAGEGDALDAICGQAAALDGVARVLKLAGAHNAQLLAATLAPQVVALAAGYTHVLGPSTTFGKDLMPRVGALLGVPPITDLSLIHI